MMRLLKSPGRPLVLHTSVVVKGVRSMVTQTFSHMICERVTFCILVGRMALMYSFSVYLLFGMVVEKHKKLFENGAVRVS